MLAFFFAPSYSAKAKRIINRTEQGIPFNKVFFKNDPRPLYYPASFPYLSLQQVVCECFYPDNWHFYEVPETRVRPDDTVVDCGAAEGLFGFLVADRCKKLYLVEPVKDFCNALALTFESQDNVEILQVAVSSEDGVATISENNISSSITQNGTGARIQVARLDALFFDKNIPVSYIKIDLEGFDYDALRGAENLIRANKPRIAVTTYHKKEHAAQIEAYLKGIVPEYKIFTKGIYQETGSPVMLHAWVD